MTARGCYWPCCNRRGIMRLDTFDGEVMWARTWGFKYPNQLVGGPRVSSIITDGDYLYAGGQRVSDRANLYVGTPFSIRKYDERGDMVWQTDVGGNVCQLLLTSAGIAVSHYPSIPTGQPLLVTSTPSHGKWYIGTPFNTNPGLVEFAEAADGPTVQRKLEETSFWKGKIAVTGTSLSAGGLTFTIDESVGGETDLFPLLMIPSKTNTAVFIPSGVKRSFTADIANVAMIDPSDGSIIWRKFLANRAAAPYEQKQGVFVSTGGLANFDGHLVVSNHPDGFDESQQGNDASGRWEPAVVDLGGNRVNYALKTYNEENTAGVKYHVTGSYTNDGDGGGGFPAVPPVYGSVISPGDGYDFDRRSHDVAKYKDVAGNGSRLAIFSRRLRKLSISIYVSVPFIAGGAPQLVSTIPYWEGLSLNSTDVLIPVLEYLSSKGFGAVDYTVWPPLPYLIGGYFVYSPGSILIGTGGTIPVTYSLGEVIETVVNTKGNVFEYAPGGNVTMVSNLETRWGHYIASLTTPLNYLPEAGNHLWANTKQVKTLQIGENPATTEVFNRVQVADLTPLGQIKQGVLLYETNLTGGNVFGASPSGDFCALTTLNEDSSLSGSSDHSSSSSSLSSSSSRHPTSSSSSSESASSQSRTSSSSSSSGTSSQSVSSASAFSSRSSNSSSSQSESSKSSGTSSSSSSSLTSSDSSSSHSQTSSSSQSISQSSSSQSEVLATPFAPYFVIGRLDTPTQRVQLHHGWNNNDRSRIWESLNAKNAPDVSLGGGMRVTSVCSMDGAIYVAGGQVDSGD